MNGRKSYSSDLTTAQWNKIRRLIPPAQVGGRPRQVSMREVVNAILYRVKNGCKWEDLPHDFPPYQTVYEYYNAWIKNGLWESLHEKIVRDFRRETGRKVKPSGGILDSQSVKAAKSARETGYDAGKKVKGRKRHILVDTQGLPQKVMVHPANIQDRDGAKALLSQVKDKCKGLVYCWVDGGGKLVDWAKETLGITLNIVKRSDEVSGFVVLPRRWLVERTFAGLGDYRLLDKERETRPQASECDVYAASMHRMLRFLAPA